MKRTSSGADEKDIQKDHEKQKAKATKQDVFNADTDVTSYNG